MITLPRTLTPYQALLLHPVFNTTNMAGWRVSLKYAMSRLLCRDARSVFQITIGINATREDK